MPPRNRLAAVRPAQLGAFTEGKQDKTIFKDFNRERLLVRRWGMVR